MSEWKKVKIGDFLEQYRNTIYIDDSVEYGQITISSKDGVKYRCTKSGKEIGRKRQFVIDLKTHPNTVIFTRQGIADGSIGIAPQEVDGCIATENMPMFSVNEDYILIDYLRYLFISPTFRNLIATITPTGSAQKAIHERELLPLEISIPDLQTQQEIVKKTSSQLQKAEQVSIEIESQKNYIKQLRQNILQQAIEGKLTSDWRKQNPVQKGNPDYDAEALFEQIQKERNGEKKQKVLSPITDEEKPFEIPEGWKWVRLGDVSNKIEAGKSILCNEKIPSDDEIGIVKTGVCSFGKFKENESKTCLSKNDWHDEYEIKKGDFLIGRANTLELVGSCVIVDSINKKLMLSDKILRIVFCNFVNHFFILYMMKSKFLRSQIEKSSTGSSPTMKNISQESIKNYVLPLPSLKEQEEIVKQVEKHLQTVSDIENQITKREQLTKQLMQSILKDAFEEK